MERKTLVIKTLKEHDMESEDEEDVADYRQGKISEYFIFLTDGQVGTIQ